MTTLRVTAPLAGAPSPGRALESLDFVLSPRVTRAARVRPAEHEAGAPLHRPLRVFALDPSASSLEGAMAVVNVPYESLEPGPVGAHLRVVDDGLAGLIAERPPARLDLGDPHVLVGQGRAPSVTDPQFRAQMAYAVCSATHAAFRRALGREPAWGFDSPDDRARLVVRSCVPMLTNAYYDAARGEIRLGAFLAEVKVEGRNVPKQPVCTALMHDVVAHEMAHALLDGLRARFLFPSNPDVLAFHEAFADLVAVFQRFTYREVVRAAIRQTRGDLGQESVLTAIGRQFAQTAGYGGALRTAVLDSERRYAPTADPHAAGEVLLAAVFRAYSTVFRRKAARYVRLATDGTGVLPAGEAPELLTDRLTELACGLAEHFLTICIRAIDYCPPVDITFGEYLRALITADGDLVADDPWGYREAWVDAFRLHGIYPPGVRALTEDALRWQSPEEPVPPVDDLSFARLRFGGDPAQPADETALREQAAALGRLVTDPQWRRTFGFAQDGEAALGGDRVDLPVVESIRTSRRVGPDGQVLFDLVGEVIQRRRVAARDGAPGFDFYGGSTVILDPHGQVRYLVRKSVLDGERLDAQRTFVTASENVAWDRGGAFAFPEPKVFMRLHGARTAGATPTRAQTAIPAAVLDAGAAGVTRTDGGDARAYPLDEAQAPRRVATTPVERAAQLVRIVDWLAVERSARYAADDGEPSGRAYAADVCQLADAYLPRVWWTGGALARLAAGQRVDPLLGETVTVLTTDRLAEWLAEFGQWFGWRRVDDAASLQQAANDGRVGVICARGAGGAAGRVTVVVPESAACAAVTDATGLVPVQSGVGWAGWRCVAERWWQSGAYRDAGFWMHV